MDDAGAGMARSWHRADGLGDDPSCARSGCAAEGCASGAQDACSQKDRIFQIQAADMDGE